MSAISIGFSERLKQEKIFDPEKADAFARALNDELSDRLATKPDLVQLENRMENRMIQMENRMTQMENRIIKWMVGLILAAIAINLTVTGFLVTL